MDAGQLILRLPRPARRHRVIRVLLRLGLPPESVVPLAGGAPVHVDLREPWARVALISGSYYPQFQ